MKKRILTLLLAFIMCLTMVPAAPVYAEEDVKITAEAQVYSNWAFNDLMVGDTYGIYPIKWYSKDMTGPISQSQLLVLMYGVRGKLLDTDCVTSNQDLVYNIKKNITVETALNAFYEVLSGFEFSGDLGLNGKTAVNFMKDNGIYTGANGELGLKDTCSIEQACVIATRLITYVYDKLDAASKGFLWVTKSGENTVYMLGSVHFASYDIYPFSKEILEAYQSSNALGLELNFFDTAGAMKLAELAVYSDGTTLKDHVSEETYQKTITLAATLGFTEDMVLMLKPWYLYLTFSSLGYTETGSQADAAQAANLGIDMNLATNALIYGKPIIEVEGYEKQGMAIDSFSDELEEYLLNSTIDEVNDVFAGKSTAGSDNLELMLELWRDGDVESFIEYNSFEDEYPEVYGQEEVSSEKALMDEFKDKLLTQRDKGMAEYIDGLLKAEGSNTYFIVVGSLHYASDYSVLDILKDKGYEINQIK